MHHDEKKRTRNVSATANTKKNFRPQSQAKQRTDKKLVPSVSPSKLKGAVRVNIVNNPSPSKERKPDSVVKNPAKFENLLNKTKNFAQKI